MTVSIVFETHSTSTDNEAGIATGWLPGHLSERGRLEASELGARRRQDAIDAVFTSDLARAIETAEIAFSQSDIPILEDWRLRECNYGLLNGQRVSLLEGRRSEYIDRPFPNGQSYRQVVQQMRDFLRDLSSSRDGERLLLVAHSATRWALEDLLKGVPLEDLVDGPFNWKAGWEYLLS